MSGSSLPPEGFRWVEPGGGRAAAPGRRARRWWWIGAAIVLVAAVLLGGVVALGWGPFERRAAQGTSAAPPPIGTPKDRLVSFPLNRQPVPGWQVTLADMGLPAGVHQGTLFASTDTKAYFITGEECRASCATPTGWLYGLDVTTGARLFPPLAIPGYYYGTGDCFGNDPRTAVCTTHVLKGAEERFAPTAWVIDLERGAITFSGPNGLDPESGNTYLGTLTTVGNRSGETYAVNTVADKGVYGIGSHAERTWFLPGSGQLQTPWTQGSDVPSLTLAVQTSASAGADRGPRVFSVIDGKDLTPTVPAGTKLESPVIYNGGFAYNFDQGGTAGTLMYDTAGRLVGRQEPDRSYTKDNAGMLTVLVGGKFVVYTALGKPVIEIPAADTGSEFQTIGTRVFVKTPGTYGADETWQWWDLLTRRPGPTCTMQLGADYGGSDGTVVITNRKDRGLENHYVGIDVATCQSLWDMTGRIVMSKVGTSLIVHGNDTIMSLRAPN